MKNKITTPNYLTLTQEKPFRKSKGQLLITCINGGQLSQIMKNLFITLNLHPHTCVKLLQKLCWSLITMDSSNWKREFRSHLFHLQITHRLFLAVTGLPTPLKTIPIISWIVYWEILHSKLNLLFWPLLSMSEICIQECHRVSLLWN